MRDAVKLGKGTVGKVLATSWEGGRIFPGSSLWGW